MGKTPRRLLTENAVPTTIFVYTNETKKQKHTEAAGKNVFPSIISWT